MTDAFSIAALRDAMRRMEALPNDVIAVSYLFPDDKVLGFSDDTGTVWAMGLRAWAHIEKEATANGPTQNPFAASPTLAGVKVYFLDRDRFGGMEITRRIASSIQAGVSVAEFLARLGFGPTPPDGASGT